MQQLRFLFAMALLYMFRVTISPIIRSTYAVYGQCWNKSNQMQQLRFLYALVYSTCFGWQSNPSSGVHMLYMANGEIIQQDATIAFLFAMALLHMFRSTIPTIIRCTNAVYGQWWNNTTRCNNCVFILSNGFTLHVSGDNLTHHHEYICCTWPILK